MQTNLATQLWAETHFGKIMLADRRRVQRTVTIAQAMATNPGHSIPQLFPRWTDLKASYNLFNLVEATPDNLQAGHRDWVRTQLQQPGTFLLLEDTTELAWAHNQPRAGLGPVAANKPRYQGFHLHSVLAVRWDNEIKADEGKRPPVGVIGLCDQQYYVRRKRPAGERKDDSQARKKRERESKLWLEATTRIGLQGRAGNVRLVRVADRGADIYEYLRDCQHHRHGFVIRAAQDRLLCADDSDEKSGRLFSRLAEAPVLGQFEMELRARPKQPARQARLTVSAVKVNLRAPQRPGGRKGNPAIKCAGVRVWEADPPAGVSALEWVLLCDAEVGSFEQAMECVRQYATRWLVEEFHKALKSGLGAERLQLKTASALFAAIAIMSIVALRLIELRERVEAKTEQPAEEAGLEAVELAILRHERGREIKTVGEVALAIGRLGGHLNRRGDGLPGWQTLWRGMCHLRALAEGVRLSYSLHNEFG